MATKKAGAKKTASKTAASSKKSTKAKSAKTTKRTNAGSSAKNTTTAASDQPILKRAKSVSWLSILESVVIGVLGVLLIIDPNWVTRIVFYVIGIFLMVKGVYKIVNYFAMRGRYDFYNNDLLYGVIALLIGIIAVVLWEKMRDIIGLVVGAWMIYGALVRLNYAIKLHAAGARDWFWSLLLSLLMLALGIYLIVSMGAGVVNIFVIAGWVMIAAAVIGIVNEVVFMREIDAITK